MGIGTIGISWVPWDSSGNGGVTIRMKMGVKIIVWEWE